MPKQYIPKPYSPNQMDWSADNIEKLRVMWAAGNSISQIAVVLRTSRSAVAGKLRRLKLAKKHAPSLPEVRL